MYTMYFLCEKELTTKRFPNFILLKKEIYINKVSFKCLTSPNIVHIFCLTEFTVKLRINVIKFLFNKEVSTYLVST